MKLLTAAVLLMAVTASAQSAKVVRLSPGDAARAKQLDADQKELSDRAGRFHDYIIRTYLVTTSVNEAGRCCDNTWSDPEDKQGSLTEVGITGTFLVADGSSRGACETPAEKAQRLEIERKEKDAQAAYEKAHPTKYYKSIEWKGGFQYSEGFEYIVPEKETKFYPASCGMSLTGDSH